MSKLAILGGETTRKDPYPAWPVFDQRDVQTVTDVVASGQWGGYPVLYEYGCAVNPQVFGVDDFVAALTKIQAQGPELARAAAEWKQG